MIKRISSCFSTSKTIILDYNDLIKKDQIFYKQIEHAYGSKGHGILVVSNIPNFVQTRKMLLPLNQKLATLPPNILKNYMRPQIFHSLGWSCGVEQFHGKYDVSKGSFYVRATSDAPSELSPQHKKFYSQTELAIRATNKWVKQIPELEKYTKQMSKLMISTGALIAKQIDAYAKKVLPAPMKLSLQQMVSNGKSHIGRLLHYFPFQAKEDVQDDWCGWHNDHGALTALTSSMYIDKDGKQIDFQETNGGLFAKNRYSDATKISIPKNMMAFQLGESAQILTGGALEATPHCVVRSQQLSGKNISRNSFALFMQPDQLQKMQVPSGMSQKGATNKSEYKIPPLQNRWDNGIFFKEFHARTLKEYS